MSDANRLLDANELHARFRDLALPWEMGHELAVSCAIDTVRGMRAAFNEFAGTDPYEAGKVEHWDMSAEIAGDDPTVRAMAARFSLILNRQGLLKINPALG
jgi:hypothetical protein